jgi:hypothetical protein
MLLKFNIVCLPISSTVTNRKMDLFGNAIHVLKTNQVFDFIIMGFSEQWIFFNRMNKAIFPNFHQKNKLSISHGLSRSFMAVVQSKTEKGYRLATKQGILLG